MKRELKREARARSIRVLDVDRKIIHKTVFPVGRESTQEEKRTEDPFPGNFPPPVELP